MRKNHAQKVCTIHLCRVFFRIVEQIHHPRMAAARPRRMVGRRNDRAAAHLAASFSSCSWVPSCAVCTSGSCCLSFPSEKLLVRDAFLSTTSGSPFSAWCATAAAYVAVSIVVLRSATRARETRGAGGRYERVQEAVEWAGADIQRAPRPHLGPWTSKAPCGPIRTKKNSCAPEQNTQRIGATSASVSSSLSHPL